MVGLFVRRLPVLLLAFGVWGLAALPGEACPFCTSKGQTLTEEVAQANLVVFCDPRNADEVKETTDLKIESVIKDHKERKKRDLIEVKRYIPPTLDGVKYKYLVFFDIFEGKLDPYKGMAVRPGSKLPKYLTGALAVKDRPI